LTEMMQVPLRKMFSEEFPVTGRLVYLNHAAVAPLCRRAAVAMQHFAQDALEFGSLHYDQWLACYDGLRAAAAKLIHAHQTEIAITKNTSEGIATIAGGIRWRHGDVIVAFQEEFPANFLPWKRLEQDGVEIRWLSIFDPLDRVDQACTGARLLAVSFVQYLSGFRIDLERFGEICSRRGCFFFVDAIQGLGAFPIDVRRAKISALAADGHKWLLGPEGCGILYVQADLQDEISPPEFGWTNVAAYNDYASRDLALRCDAARYECGTLNTIGCYGLRAAIELLLEIGVENIAADVQSLCDRIWDGVRNLGFETLGIRSPETGAGIVSFRRSGTDASVIVRRLREAGFIAAPRQGWVRTAPHFYIAPENIDALLDQISKISESPATMPVT
jgi:cysteine desulfurase / selenocysteine lyase